MARVLTEARVAEINERIRQGGFAAFLGSLLGDDSERTSEVSYAALERKFAANADVRDIDAVFLHEDDKNLNSIGGKGIGEIGIVGAAAAIANAVYHATGLRVRDLPIRIEDVRPALKDLRAR